MNSPLVLRFSGAVLARDRPLVGSRGMHHWPCFFVGDAQVATLLDLLAGGRLLVGSRGIDHQRSLKSTRPSQRLSLGADSSWSLALSSLWVVGSPGTDHLGCRPNHHKHNGGPGCSCKQLLQYAPCMQDPGSRSRTHVPKLLLTWQQICVDLAPFVLLNTWLITYVQRILASH